MLAPFQFVETSPSAAGTAASSQPVTNVGSTYPNGIAFPLDDCDAVDVIAEFGGNTGGSLTVYIQINPDGAGLNWYDIVAFPTASAGTSAKIYQAPISNSTNTTQAIVVGKNLVPALVPGANGAVVNGAFSERMRVVMVSGASTSAGTSVKVTVSGQRRWNRQNG